MKELSPKEENKRAKKSNDFFLGGWESGWGAQCYLLKNI